MSTRVHSYCSVPSYRVPHPDSDFSGDPLDHIATELPVDVSEEPAFPDDPNGQFYVPHGPNPYLDLMESESSDSTRHERLVHGVIGVIALGIMAVIAVLVTSSGQPPVSVPFQFF